MSVNDTLRLIDRQSTSIQKLALSVVFHVVVDCNACSVLDSQILILNVGIWPHHSSRAV